MLLRIRDYLRYTVVKSLVRSKVPASQKKEYSRGNKIFESVLGIDTYMKANNLHNPSTKELVMNAKSSYCKYIEVLEGKPITARDEIMADRIEFLAEHNDDKIIVWAHNAHISNEVIIDNEIGLMGNKLKESFGSDYFLIGLSSLNGTYSYLENRFINDDHSYTDVLKSGTLSYQPKLTWESVMADMGDTPFYLISENINSQFDGQRVFGKAKLLGYAKESKEDYYDVNPFAMFDGLFFIKNTIGTTPLFNK